MCRNPEGMVDSGWKWYHITVRHSHDGKVDEYAVLRYGSSADYAVSTVYPGCSEIQPIACREATDWEIENNGKAFKM